MRDNKIKEIIISHGMKYPLIRCPHCDATYVYIRVFKSKETYLYGNDDVYMQQISSEYCPECGKKIEEEK